MTSTEVVTTFGKTVRVDERELADLTRQGLVVSKPKPKPKDTTAAPAGVDEAEALAEADTKGGAE